MSNIITAGNATNNGTSISSDTSGVLELKTGSTPTTALTIGTSGQVGVGSTPSYGTSGQVLTSAGSGAAPTWAAVGSSGVAKAWVQFSNPAGGSPTINGSLNVSSITRNAMGNYNINFSTAMPNTAYCANLNASTASNNTSFSGSQIFSSAIGTAVAPTVNGFQFIVYHPLNGVLSDSPYICASVQSS